MEPIFKNVFNSGERERERILREREDLKRERERDEMIGVLGHDSAL